MTVDRDTGIAHQPASDLLFRPAAINHTRSADRTSLQRKHVNRGLIWAEVSPATYLSAMRRGAPLGLPGGRSSAKFLSSLTRLLVNQVGSYLLQRQRMGHCL